MDNSILPEYLLSEEDYNELWRDCIFIMDSSAIFNVYRYSSNLRNEVKKILDTISARLWIPYQVAYEYHDNLESVINEEVQRYSKIMDSISKIQKPGKLELDDNLRRKHTPHYDLISYLEKRIKDIESEFENHLQEIKEDTRKIEKKCPKKEELAEINALIHSYFNGKVGKSYSLHELEKISEMGDKRYDLLLPPGYKDRKDKKGLKIYGDLIIWLQIIDMAKDRNVHVIFICDDLKGDWWWKSSSGSTIGPRPELIQEFHSETNKLFWMYSLDRFLEYASTYIDVKIDEKAIKEAGEYRIEEEKRLERYEVLSDFLRAYPGISEYHSEPYILNKDFAEAISRAYGYQEALRSAPESMKSYQDALRSVVESMKPYQDALRSAAESMNPNQDALRSVAESMKSYQEALRSAPESMKSYQDALRSVVESMKPYQDALRSAAESMNPNQDALRSVAESMKSYQEALRSAPESMKSYQDALRSVVESMKPYQDALRSAAESMNPNQDALRSVVESMKPYQEMWKFSPLLHQNLYEKSEKQPNSHDADE